MSMHKAFVWGGAIVLLSMPSLLAQTRSTTGGTRPTATSSTGSTTGRGKHQPCWEQAGIPQSVVQEHRSIEQSTRSEIQAVCSDSSLTPQQRQQKAHELREQARQRQDAMLSASQRTAFKNCRSQRGEGGTPGLGGESLCGASSIGGRKIPGTPPSTGVN